MKRTKTGKIALIVVGILVAIMIIGLCVRMGSSQTYTTLSATDYEVGALDTAGAFKKNAGSFVSKDFYDVDGLSVKVEEDAELSYQLYFYDAEENFISATNQFAVTYNGTIPEDAELFKVVINPTNDDDISTFDIINYGSDVEVRYYK
ncbi:MAG: hypothetical protein ACLRFL_03090 [Clostridia bacterium]